jgi:hypothetical protein
MDKTGMERLLIALFALFASLCSVRAADPGAFNIELKVQSGVKVAKAGIAKFPVRGTTQPGLEVKTGDPLQVSWILARAGGSETYKDVLVHCYLARAEKLNQASVAKLDPNVVAEFALYMDFKPNDRAEGKLDFVVDQAGIYLLRLETIGAANAGNGQEYFAFLDVVVK